MYKKLVTKPREKITENDKNQHVSEKPLNVHLKFKEILCPMTNKPLQSTNCSKCLYKKEYHRKHDLGLTLSTIICTWSETE